MPDSCKDIYSFENVLNWHQKIYETKANTLDLSRISFIEPYSMLNLLLLGRNYLRASGEKLKITNVPLPIHQYLIRMDFDQKGVFDFSKELADKDKLKRSSISKRVIEIIDIPNKERESVKIISNVISLFRERASFILKYWLSDQIINYFVTVISEICQNVFEHSLDSGYLTIQTYNIGKEHHVRMTIADSGIGIEGSFQNSKKIEYSSPADLIKQALTTPISSKRNFGYGLCQVNSIVSKLNGNLFVRSGNSSVAMIHSKKKKSDLYAFMKNDLVHFPGTQISITLIS
jgi:anti-sigma regulatory factor (Ser/Thr protein kinase)